MTQELSRNGTGLSLRGAALLALLGLTSAACAGDDESAEAPASNDAQTEPESIEYTNASVLVHTLDYIAAWDTDTGELHFSVSLDDDVIAEVSPGWDWVMATELDEETGNPGPGDPDQLTIHWLPTEAGGDLTTSEISLNDVEGLEKANLAHRGGTYRVSAREDDTVYTIRAEINDAAECAILYAVRIDLPAEEAEVLDTAEVDAGSLGYHGEGAEGIEHMVALGDWQMWPESQAEPTTTICSPEDEPTLDTPSGDIMWPAPGEEPHNPGALDIVHGESGDPEEHSDEAASMQWVGTPRARESDGIFYAFEQSGDGPLTLYRMYSNGTHQEVEVPDEVEAELSDYDEANLAPVTIPYEDPETETDAEDSEGDPNDDEETDDDADELDEGDGE